MNLQEEKTQQSFPKRGRGGSKAVWSFFLRKFIQNSMYSRPLIQLQLNKYCFRNIYKYKATAAPRPTVDAMYCNVYNTGLNAFCRKSCDRVTHGIRVSFALLDISNISL